VCGVAPHTGTYYIPTILFIYVRGIEHPRLSFALLHLSKQYRKCYVNLSFTFCDQKIDHCGSPTLSGNKCTYVSLLTGKTSIRDGRRTKHNPRSPSRTKVLPRGFRFVTKPHQNQSKASHFCSTIMYRCRCRCRWKERRASTQFGSPA